MSHYFQFYYHKQLKKIIILIILPLTFIIVSGNKRFTQHIFFITVMTGGKASQ